MIILSYFPIIDILRFIAAFGVMCFHYFSSTFQGLSDPISLFVRYGYLGVELFFIISGFIIFFSVSKPPKEYALGRFLRIYPIFWIMCSITYIATLVFPHADHVSFLTFLKNLLIINNGKIEMIDGVYWTLTIEIFFYIYIGAYNFLFGKKNLHYFFISWLLICLTIFTLDLQNLLISKLLLARYAPYFIYGGLVAYLYENRSIITKRLKYLLISVTCLTAFVPYYISKVLSNNINDTNFFGVFDTKANIIVFMFFILIPLAIYFSEKITSKNAIKIAKILGGITYPLYLIHQKLGGLIIGETFGLLTIVSFSTAICMVLVCLIVSIKEEKWRKSIYKKIINSNFFRNDKVN